ncbi:uncharacterized protein LOC130737295 [Lotus japonicus]|uniref:uncharacterized protein LOC130737295 n=1 Tax=Lotus japonicus TaxID=34305 RepID=UPI0025885EF2|nr:uncharacterized protein LOC130737295 [Lotus japonicus]
MEADWVEAKMRFGAMAGGSGGAKLGLEGIRHGQPSNFAQKFDGGRHPLKTPVTRDDGITCKFSIDPIAVLLGYLSVAFHVASTVAGFLILFWTNKKKSDLPQVFDCYGCNVVIVNNNCTEILSLLYLRFPISLICPFHLTLTFSLFLYLYLFCISSSLYSRILPISLRRLIVLSPLSALRWPSHHIPFSFSFSHDSQHGSSFLHRAKHHRRLFCSKRATPTPPANRELLPFHGREAITTPKLHHLVIQDAKVFMVGTGGIGYGLLKTLALSCFSDINTVRFV